MKIIADGTPQALIDLARNPLADISCIFPDGQSAMAIWYMNAGCIALNEVSDLAPLRLQDFRVQPLCPHHNDRQEPLESTTPDVAVDDIEPALIASVNPRLLHGAHLLVDRTVGPDNRFPVEPWSLSGPHWSDTAGLDGDPLPPALELGYGMAKLREFAADTELGRLVFAGYAHLLR